jgi:hypothetical protein
MLCARASSPRYSKASRIETIAKKSVAMQTRGDTASWLRPPVTRNAEIDPGDNDPPTPPPKMTQGVMPGRCSDNRDHLSLLRHLR